LSKSYQQNYQSDKIELQFLTVAFKFINAANKLAKKYFNNKKNTKHLKKDETLVTTADLEISELARKILSKCLDEKYIITEEYLDNLNALIKNNTLKNAEYLVFIDPIDGTRNYANNIPFYGISLGILKNLKPWLGIVSFPELNELFYADSKNAYILKYPYKIESKIQLRQIKEKINWNSVFFCNDSFFKIYDWNYNLCMASVNGCSVMALCYPLAGRGCGAIFGAHIWDFAGAWAIMKKLNFNLYNIKTSEQLEYFNPKDFVLPNWKLKDYYILSTADNFKILRDNIIPKK